MSRISVLALVEQYLEFVERVRVLPPGTGGRLSRDGGGVARLSQVPGCWIPKQAHDEEASGEEMAAILQFRLKRLEAMRDAASRLVTRNGSGVTCLRAHAEAVIGRAPQHLYRFALRSPDGLCRPAAASGDHKCA